MALVARFSQTLAKRAAPSTRGFATMTVRDALNSAIKEEVQKPTNTGCCRGGGGGGGGGGVENAELRT